MSNPNQVPQPVEEPPMPIEALPFEEGQAALDPLAAIKLHERRKGALSSFEGFVGSIDNPDPESIRSLEEYLNQRPAGPGYEGANPVRHGRNEVGVDSSDISQLHRDQVIGRWAMADLLGDSSVSNQMQSELENRVYGMRYVDTVEQQRMLDAQKRRMNELQDEYVRGLSDEELGSLPKSDQARITARKEVLRQRDLMNRIEEVGIDGLSDEEFRSIRGRMAYDLNPDLHDAYIRRWDDIRRGDSASAETGGTADRPDDDEPAWLGHNPYDVGPRDGSSESGQDNRPADGSGHRTNGENRRPYWWEVAPYASAGDETGSESAGTDEDQAPEVNADEGDQPVRSNPLVGPEAYGDAPPSSQNGERRRDPSDEGILPQPQIEPRGSFWQRMGQGIKRAGHTVNLWGRVLPREPNHPETKVSAIKGFARSPKRLVASVGGALRRAWESFRRPDEESDESEIPVEDFFNTERSPDHNRHPEV